MPDIYADVILLVRKKNFIILPEIYYQSEWIDFFTLSHNLQAREELCIDKSDHGFGIVYAMDLDFMSVINSKYLRVNRRNEVTVILSKIFKEINLRQPQIFISIDQGNLLVLAVNEGKLQLCNAYQVHNTDEIFYFVMLAIEQLQFLPAETELVILGKPVLKDALKELFKNYIQEIRIWSEPYRIEPGLMEEALIDNSFAMQTILCE